MFRTILWWARAVSLGSGSAYLSPTGRPVSFASRGRPLASWPKGLRPMSLSVWLVAVKLYR